MGKNCEIDEDSLKKLEKRFLKKVPEEYRRKLFERVLPELSRNPYSGEKLKGKLEKFWKYRVGRYRLIYYPMPCRIIPLIFKPREGVYK